MKAIVSRVNKAHSSKSDRDFLICIAKDENNDPIKFFASVDDYAPGDKVELYVEADMNFMARVAHRKI